MLKPSKEKTPAKQRSRSNSVMQTSVKVAETLMTDPNLGKNSSAFKNGNEYN